MSEEQRFHYNASGTNSPTDQITGPVAAAAAAAAAAAPPPQPPLAAAVSSSSFAFPESPVTIDAAKRQMMEAITLLPLEDRQYFENAPADLVLNETDPLLFLRTHDFDIWKSARRLVEYWKFRHETFGSDRCYLPLDLSGTNAVSPSAVKLTETGVGYLLPPDTKGRSVLMCECKYNGPKDDEKLGITRETRFQTSFYLLHLLSQEPESSVAGCTIINLIDQRQHKVSPSMYEWWSRATRDCFPLRLKGMHLVFAPFIRDDKKRLSFTQTLLPFIWQLLQERFQFTRRSLDFVPVASKAKCKDDIANLLISKSHFHPDALPHSAGGEWCYAKFKEWKNITTDEVTVQTTTSTTSNVEAATDPTSVTSTVNGQVQDQNEGKSAPNEGKFQATTAAAPSRLEVLAAAALAETDCTCQGMDPECPQKKKKRPYPPAPKILSRVFRRKEKHTSSK